MSAPASAACPRCGAFARMLPIVFGFPMPETFAAAERGEIALGGCMVSGEDPTHRCTSCHQDVILDRVDGFQAIDSCAAGGLLLDGDPDELANGDPGAPLCGACRRNSEFAAIEEVVLWDEVTE